MIGLQLNVPIFQGGYVNSQVREALALLERAENRLDEIRKDLNVRVHREYRGVTEGVLKVRALEQAVRSSEIAPSGVVWPRPMPSSSEKALATRS